jgi:hypothetical protein
MKTSIEMANLYNTHSHALRAHHVHPFFFVRGGVGVTKQDRRGREHGSCPTRALFAWLISHQPIVLFSQNKPATSNQQPANSTFLSEQISTSAISHQPNEQAADFVLVRR